VNIADLRQEYMRAGLAEADALADPFAQFERWFQEALAAQLPLANAMTLATVTDQGAPDARIVLLKGVDDGGFVFYTNYESRKGRQLAARPLACLVFLWTQLERQVRVEGAVTKVTPTESDAYFATRPAGARVSAAASAQSEVVADRAALEAEVQKLTATWGQNPPRPAHWGGYRVVPSQIEFWQGRENRLHDRLLYRRGIGGRIGGWTVERLAP
jgi:pyridoxamine 5'-phosphate oxidase